jgi:hypothetical protein
MRASRLRCSNKNGIVPILNTRVHLSDEHTYCDLVCCLAQMSVSSECQSRSIGFRCNMVKRAHLR